MLGIHIDDLMVSVGVIERQTKTTMTPNFHQIQNDKIGNRKRSDRELTKGNQKFSIAFPLIRRKGEDACQII